MGRLPLSSFIGNEKTIIDEILYKDEGIKPESLFTPSPRYSKLLSWPKGIWNLTSQDITT